MTKRSAEALAEFLTEHGAPATYLHADLDAPKRLKALNALRNGHIRAVVGCNLLREGLGRCPFPSMLFLPDARRGSNHTGLDLPQVSLVAIVGAEKQGYLRSATSLIQTIGRAARHVNGTVLLYTDEGKVSDAMFDAV